MINEEYINKVLNFEGLLVADVKEWNTKANAIHRGWTDLGEVFNKLAGWEATTLDDGFPILKPKNDPEDVCSYIYVTTSLHNVPQFNVNICTEIDAEYGEPFYSSYTCTYAPDLMPLLIAFGV